MPTRTSAWVAEVLLAMTLCFAGPLPAAAVDSAKPKGTPDAPKSRADWPVERVLVIGYRGNLRNMLANHTLRGTEGFADGSAPVDNPSRSEYPWQVYYASDGTLEARFRRIGSRVPHGVMEELDFVEFGRWDINDDGELCQSIPKVGSGTTVCYEVDRRGDRMAMYYSRCGAFNRCYPGRLGPEGEIVPGRAFTR
jgi:hypothetical protein